MFAGLGRGDEDDLAGGADATALLGLVAAGELGRLDSPGVSFGPETVEELARPPSDLLRLGHDAFRNTW